MLSNISIKLRTLLSSYKTETSVILVLRFISILVLIQFLRNLFSFYLVQVHLKSIILVLIQFSFSK